LKQLPNLLSGLRLALAPYIFYLLGTRQFRAALVWFALAGVSDGLDGWAARRFSANSRVGALLDPVADKVLLSGSFLTLGLTSVIPWWLTFVVLGRDAMILLFAIVAMATKKLREFPPSIWGKLSTAVQIAYVLAVVANEAGFGLGEIVAVLGWATLAFTLISGLDYALRVASPAP
jgi:cardiolipin synthase (CMP-forming)